MSSRAGADVAHNARHNWKPVFLRALRERGTVTKACQAAKVSRTAVYRARQQDEEFAVAWAEVDEEVTDLLEASALAIALAEDPAGEEHPPTRAKMIELLLKARRPDRYTERRNVEHSGRITLEDALRELRALDDEQLAG